jgi:uncharacterized protein YggE
MAPLIITTTGTSTISRPAERATVTIQVNSSGPSQQEVSQDVISTSQTLQNSLKELSSGTETGRAAAGSGMIQWSLSTLSTFSYPMWNDAQQVHVDPTKKREMKYTASTTLTIKFANLKLLGGVCTDLSELQFVSIRSIEWSLTDATTASLNSQSRREAVQDAVAKARDYAAAVDVMNVKAVDIQDQGAPHRFGGRGTTRAQGPQMGQGRPEENRLNFEPENCELNCSVTVRFEGE